MPKIDEMPKYRASLPKHSHDLSHDFGFTCSTAQLLPVFHDYLNAGETVELGFNFFLRTQPLQSAAMSKLRCHTEYFFVPMALLYQPFGSFLYGITDEFSSQFSSTLMDELPVVAMNDIMDDYAGTRTARTLYAQNGYLFGDTDIALAYRLADMFGFDPQRMVQGSVPADHVNPNVFPYQYLAYNCIYQYYYRLDNREAFNQNDFNFDKFYTNSSALTSSDITNWRRMFALRFRPLSNDYFTDVKVSPIVDVLNLNNKTNLQVANNWLSRNTFAPNHSVLKSGRVGSEGSYVSNSPDFYNITPSTSIVTQFGFTADTSNLDSKDTINGSDINTANIRALFATEKLWSITGRVKKHYDDQTLAHFGFEVPHDPKHEITCFGHDVSDINIGEVISTSNTWDGSNGSPLAEIAGKGYGSQSGKKHKFTAPCHGVVMVIYSVTIDRNYIEGVPKYNVMRNRSDLYQPEYDHLGMQPVFVYETSDIDFNSHGDIFGWQYRYEQWKRRYNRLTKAFQDNSFVPGAGAFASWFNVSHANLADMSNSANTNTFVNFMNYPTDINSIMLVSYQVNITGATGFTNFYGYDPFIVASHIDCHKLSTMSDYSLPRLDA